MIKRLVKCYISMQLKLEDNREYRNNDLYNINISINLESVSIIPIKYKIITNVHEINNITEKYRKESGERALSEIFADRNINAHDKLLELQKCVYLAVANSSLKGKTEIVIFGSSIDEEAVKHIVAAITCIVLQLVVILSPDSVMYNNNYVFAKLGVDISTAIEIARFGKYILRNR